MINLEFWQYRHPELGWTEQYVMLRYRSSTTGVETSSLPCTYREFQTKVDLTGKLAELRDCAETIAGARAAVMRETRAGDMLVSLFPQVDDVACEFEKASPWVNGCVMDNMGEFTKAVKGRYEEARKQK